MVKVSSDALGGRIMLNVQEITMRFGGVVAVDRFSMKVEEKEIVGLIGPNGAGKTTVFNQITGVYTPTEGKIFFDDHDITGKRPDVLTKMGMCRTFQNIRLFKELSVWDNVFIAHHLNLHKNFISGVLRLPGYQKKIKEFKQDTEQLLKMVDLWDYRDDKASSLPYGKQRRLEIARALATKPRLLLLDEPAAGMNPQETQELTGFIAKIHREFGLTILVIEHHMDVIMTICHRIYVLDHGERIAKGTPADIQSNDRVIKAYLGVE